MKIVDAGQGAPIVLVPGIQGRWEWMKPAVDALSRRARVITFSLADEPTAAGSFDPASGFSSYVRQVIEALDLAHVGRAVVCGVSYGGLIAAAVAARHPERVSALVLDSAVPPAWRPDARVRFYLRAPRLLSPLFYAASLRLFPEFVAASPGKIAAVVSALWHGANALRHPFSPGRMARRVRLLEGLDLRDELTRVNIPTLVLTGERSLDRVVPVEMTAEYLTLWPHARAVTLPRTGHLGVVTKPGLFADTVMAFVNETTQREEKRRIG
jgi:pimeloyl-ACP methyl ester carboxylesterase